MSSKKHRKRIKQNHVNKKIEDFKNALVKRLNFSKCKVPVKYFIDVKLDKSDGTKFNVKIKTKTVRIDYPDAYIEYECLNCKES